MADGRVRNRVPWRRVLGTALGSVVSLGALCWPAAPALARLPVAPFVPAGTVHGGHVVAWGLNNLGQTDVPANLTGVAAVGAGTGTGLAVKTDGTVVAWGESAAGQVNVPSGLTGVVAAAGGAYHTLALKHDGTVVGWGDSWWGQTTVPSGLSGVTAVAAGFLHSLALKSDGTVVAWGANTDGQTTVPPDLAGVTAIAAGAYHSLALKSDGTVVGWGDNSAGQASVPPDLAGVTAIAGGAYFSLALKSDGTVVAWGDNDWQQCNVPPGLTGVTAIAAGHGHALALKSDGTLVAWGTDWAGTGRVPTGLPRVTAIAAGWWHSLALVVAPPTAPTGVAVAPGQQTLTVSWSPPADIGSGTFRYYTATAAPGGATCRSTSTSCTIRRLTNGTRYTVTVVATTTDGSSPPSQRSAPGTPRALPAATTPAVELADTGTTAGWLVPIGMGLIGAGAVLGVAFRRRVGADT